jgi:hypothetical protein
VSELGRARFGGTEVAGEKRLAELGSAAAFPTSGGPAGGRQGRALLLRPGVIKTAFVDGLRFRLQPPENLMSLFAKFVLARRSAMPAKNSPPTAATAVQSASIRKVSENHDSRDEHREEPSKDELAKMMKAHLTSLDAIVHGFTLTGTFHF